MQPLSVQPLLDTAAGAPPGAPSSEAGGTGGAPRVGDLEARLAALGGAETAERVDALNALAYALPRAEAGRRGALASEARALAERLGYAAGYAAATAMTGYARLDQADPLAAVHLLREAERHEGLLPERVAFWVQAGLAEAHSALGDFEGVLRTLSALLDRVRAAGDRELEAWTLHGLSTAAADLGDAANGLALGTEALDAFTALGHEGGRTWAHGAVGTAHRLLGAYDDARAHHEAALDLARSRGDGAAEARALHDLAALALAERRAPDALLLLRVALDRQRALGLRQAEAESLLAYGRALREAGRPKEAIDTMLRALDLAGALGARLLVSRAHLALAEAYEVLGRMAQALRHLRHYQAVREEVLGLETAARLEAVAARGEAQRARDETERARRHAAELARKNDELEALLAELRRTQARLVQAEKLASLGRLTAGIAHEIKNPLNFVNNFADLSVELATELRDALGAGDVEAAAELASDLLANAETIHRHGERANAIVVAMMAHARGGSGERRPTDLHALLRQSVEIARQARIAAGDAPGGDVPEVAFDLDAGVGPLDLVPEEIGRVVVSLVTNALDAVAARAAAGEDGYAPSITVRTRRDGGGVEVCVEDNGCGMTEEVRARAFEPFFTTKPPGEGTGLGLSMAWDAARAHGGTLAATPVPTGGERLVLRLPLG
ncbi:MAG TPA: ATP-binding protein [Rubricoccaceae bacterium]|nr:ATP-binding protein [Rubricoccaceae bacterium]